MAHRSQNTEWPIKQITTDAHYRKIHNNLCNMMHLKNDMNSYKYYILLILLYLTKMSDHNAGYMFELEEHVSARYKEKACILHFLYTTAVKIVT